MNPVCSEFGISELTNLQWTFSVSGSSRMNPCQPPIHRTLIVTYGFGSADSGVGGITTFGEGCDVSIAEDVNGSVIVGSDDDRGSGDAFTVGDLR